ncbi:hypothetical protein [Streptomyces botrytidirepellens]|uniref:Uncharacterized protein n=1 Tax=Streptomyces botrytidirepellens TaxID=2486417 RepID=A0A3M8US02_9ACTN|nr:hypothetical protein [Streptomyces botrytidirepellens]RNG08226.1 hypothetical protein EEJ42_33375 [Streptomyces botrytidirepellens]
MSSLLESVRGLGRDVAMPDDLPARVAVVTATYQRWSNFPPEASVVAKFAVLRARLGPEGYQAEGFSIWDAEAEGRDALARRVSDADVIVGSNLLGSHYRAWDGAVDIEPFMARTADLFLSLYELRGGGSARGLGLSDLARGALGHRRERSKKGSGHFPAQTLWDDVTLTLTLWEMAVRLRAVPVSGRPVAIDDAALAELTGRKSRFAARADWAEQAADLVLEYPVERDSQFMLREGSTLARGALLSRAEYAIPPLDIPIPVTNTSARGPAMAWLLDEEDFVTAAQVLDPGIGALNITASWTAHRLLWANFGPSKMPGLAELSLSTGLGSARLLVPHGQRSIKALNLASVSDGDLLLLPDSRALRRELKRHADSEQLAQVLAEAGGLTVPVQASAAITARDAMVRWDAEQVLDTETWLAAQAVAT